ncbi:hypothetical protein BJ138DRAFT_1149244 [Hygrophoropsis aurantiaca]|uniref:Uncharacterized protein n=1 Tax=Hygrophoropsis aurantiaca TaxID=72124 RepID=A0ACB8AFQ6_9AGAM|nr:hypothetical protein BJ138DRAFT_1149244 [Hygrophoropsis aurantiaca]
MHRSQAHNTNLNPAPVSNKSSTSKQSFWRTRSGILTLVVIRVTIFVIAAFIGGAVGGYLSTHSWNGATSTPTSASGQMTSTSPTSSTQQATGPGPTPMDGSGGGDGDQPSGGIASLPQPSAQPSSAIEGRTAGGGIQVGTTATAAVGGWVVGK